jgi:hypothetical protein
MFAADGAANDEETPGTTVNATEHERIAPLEANDFATVGSEVDEQCADQFLRC